MFVCNELLCKKLVQNVKHHNDSISTLGRLRTTKQTSSLLTSQRIQVFSECAANQFRMCFIN